MTASILTPSLISALASVRSSMTSSSEKAVRQSGQIFGRDVAKPRVRTQSIRTSVGERVVAYLRHLHPSKTADNVSAQTGIPAGTIQKWLDRGSAPNADAYCRLGRAYGPDFLAATWDIAPSWLSEAVREQRAATLQAEIAALEAKLARVTA